jgi:8-oxo-dGTP pyrophosphatase MutT (NUDIX family)
MNPDADPLVAALERYQPRTPSEADDLARVRERIATGDPWNRSTALHVTASAMIVHPPSERVLLRWHARQQAWLQVGGHGDPGEDDPLLIAIREGREETGLDDLVGWPDTQIVHVAVVPVPAARREPVHEHADVRFVLATQQPDTARPENPTAALRWLTVPEARTITDEANVRETLARVERLFNSHSRRA